MASSIGKERNDAQAAVIRHWGLVPSERLAAYEALMARGAGELCERLLRDHQLTAEQAEQVRRAADAQLVHASTLRGPGGDESKGPRTILHGRPDGSRADPGPGSFTGPPTILHGPPTGSRAEPGAPASRDPWFLDLVERLEREALLGAGGMGEVHLVHDPRLGRKAALKVLKVDGQPQPEDVDRFLREAAITARLTHPAIPPVYESGYLPDGSPFLLMQVIEGRTLSDEIQRVKEGEGLVVARRRLVGIIEQVARAVAFAHDRGFLHRDLKSPNIMLGPFGEVLVMDWGLARRIDEGPDAAQPMDDLLGDISAEDALAAGLTIKGAVVGTPGMMPPEQAEGELVDERADVFALGALLCEVLTGEPPIDRSGGVMACLMRTARGEIAAPRDRDPSVPRDLDELARRALAFEVEERTASVRELVDQLEAWQEGRPVPGVSYTPVERLSGVVRRYPERTLAITALVLLGALMLFGGGAYWRALEASEQNRRQAEAKRLEGRLEAELTFLEKRHEFGWQQRGWRPRLANLEAEAREVIERAQPRLAGGAEGLRFYLKILKEVRRLGAVTPAREAFNRLDGASRQAPEAIVAEVHFQWLESMNQELESFVQAGRPSIEPRALTFPRAPRLTSLAATLDEEHPVGRLARALEAWHRGDAAEVRRLYEQALPRSLLGAIMLSEAHLRSGELDAALLFLALSSRFQLGHAGARFVLARHLAHSIAVTPSSEGTIRKNLEVLWHMGLLSLQYLRDDEPVLLELAIKSWLDKGDPQAAVELAKDVEKRRAGSKALVFRELVLQALVGAARLLRSRGQHRVARALLDDASRIFDEIPEAQRSDRCRRLGVEVLGYGQSPQTRALRTQLLLQAAGTRASAKDEGVAEVRRVARRILELTEPRNGAGPIATELKPHRAYALLVLGRPRAARRLVRDLEGESTREVDLLRIATALQLGELGRALSFLDSQPADFRAATLCRARLAAGDPSGAARVTETVKEPTVELAILRTKALIGCGRIAEARRFAKSLTRGRPGVSKSREDIVRSYIELSCAIAEQRSSTAQRLRLSLDFVVGQQTQFLPLFVRLDLALGDPWAAWESLCKALETTANTVELENLRRDCLEAFARLGPRLEESARGVKPYYASLADCELRLPVAPAEALELSGVALKTLEGSIAFGRVRVNALMRLGRLPEALKALDSLLESRVGRTSFYLHSLRGDLLYQLGRREEAVESYRRAVCCDWAAARSRTMLARGLLELGRQDEALIQLDFLASAERPGTAVLALRIEALKQLGRHEEAREAWRALSQRPDLNPAERDYVEKLGRSLTGSGR